MSWETLAYTDAGIELLMDAVSGKQLTITQAVGGSGLANAAVLHAQTDVTGERHALELLGIKSVEENGSAARRVKIRITGAEDTYTLHQIALFGRQTGAAEDTLLLLVQDDRGVEIPAASTDQEFEFVFTVVIVISRDAEIVINLSAEMQSLQLFVEERIQGARPVPGVSQRLAHRRCKDAGGYRYPSIEDRDRRNGKSVLRHL